MENELKYNKREQCLRKVYKHNMFREKKNGFPYHDLFIKSFFFNFPLLLRFRRFQSCKINKQKIKTYNLEEIYSLLFF